MEVSIYELLAAARESAKSDYIKGDSILCEKRFHPGTHYMVEIPGQLQVHPLQGAQGHAQGVRLHHR